MNHSRTIPAALFVLLAALCCHALAEEPYFVGLGQLSGGAGSIAMAVSADGMTVVGRAENADGDWEAFRWTAAEGMVGLGFLPNSSPYPISMANDVSDDGTVIVGTSSNGSWLADVEAFRWTQQSGTMDGLGYVYEPGIDDASQAAGVSADGAVVVGLCGSPADASVAFRWTTAGGMVNLGDLPGGWMRGRASNVSADGTIVVGSGVTYYGREAFRWTESTGLVPLGVLPGYYDSDVGEISPEGNCIVGFCEADDRVEAFRWTAEEDMVGLGFLSGGDWSEAWGTSAEGNVIVGLAGDLIGNCGAFIWTDPLEMQYLSEVLALDVGLDIGEWTLVTAYGVTPDGKYIVGEGTNPDGQTEAWLACVADPIACAGDLDGDGERDLSDLATLLASYGVDAGGDLDGDGDTDLSDLGALLAVYGRPCLQW